MSEPNSQVSKATSSLIQILNLYACFLICEVRIMKQSIFIEIQWRANICGGPAIVTCPVMLSYSGRIIRYRLLIFSHQLETFFLNLKESKVNGNEIKKKKMTQGLNVIQGSTGITLKKHHWKRRSITGSSGQTWGSTALAPTRSGS